MRVRVLLVGIVAALVVGPAPAAVALSCVANHDATVGAIADGTERMGPTGRFRDMYAGAILGRVVSQSTQLANGHPEYGRTEVVVDVTGTFGPAVASPAVIVEPDPGWMAGWAFEVGEHYFIPYLVEPDGSMHSMACDPIAIVAEDEVADLLARAEAGGWAGEATVGQDGGEAPVPAAAGDGDAVALWPFLAVAAALAAGIAGFVLRRRVTSDTDRAIVGS